MTYDEFNSLLDDAARAVLELALARGKTTLTAERRFDALARIGDALDRKSVV